MVKNKFLRENLILLIIIQLVFPTYIFADVWVADGGNYQVSRLCRSGHIKSNIKVKETPTDDNVKVDINPTALFYPGLKISFGRNRREVYMIQSLRYDSNSQVWIVRLDSTPSGVSTGDDIYQEVVTVGGFSSPVSVSANKNDGRCWIADNSTADSGVSKITNWGRKDLADTGTVTPDNGTSFLSGDRQFVIYSGGSELHPGLKVSFSRDNRSKSGFVDDYVLEIDSLDTSSSPGALTTTYGLASDHTIVDSNISFIHVDSLRVGGYTSPSKVAVNSTTQKSSSEYGICWIVEDTSDTDYLIKLDNLGYESTSLTVKAASAGDTTLTVNSNPSAELDTGIGICFSDKNIDTRYVYVVERVESDTIVLDKPLQKELSNGTKISKELVRIAGYSSPNSISVNASDAGDSYYGELWIADTEDSAVARLDRHGFKATEARVDGHHAAGDSEIALTDTSVLEAGIKIMFGEDSLHTYKVTGLPVTSNITITPALTVDIGDGDTVAVELARIIGFNKPVDVASNPNGRTGGGCWVADASDWWNTSWGYKKKLTFDNSDVYEDLTDFPVMVKLDTFILDFDKADSGASLRFVEAESNDTLPYEIESWDNVGDTAIIWVNVPLIRANSASDYIWMYYGNSSGADTQDTEAVWDDNFVMVQHLQESPANDVAGHLDSTSNDNDGTPKNFGDTSLSTTNTTGQIDGADIFDGGNDYVNCGNVSSPGEITVEAWIRATLTGDTQQRVVDKSTSGNGTGGYALSVNTDSTIHWALDGNSNTTADTIAANEWIYVAATANGTQERVYVNGAILETFSNGYTPGSSAASLWIGNSSSTSLRHFKGTIDEVRLSDVARSDSWIYAQYKAMNDSFITFGAEQSSSSASPRVVWISDEVSGVYDISSDAGYHKTFTGFVNPVSVSVNSDTGECWVADKGDNCVVKLDWGVPDGYNINSPTSGYKHIRIYGFDAPQAVAANSVTGSCWVADQAHNQVARISSVGHKYIGYMVDGTHSPGDTSITLQSDPTSAFHDTNLYPPLRVSFDINDYEDTPVYEIDNVISDTQIELRSPGLQDTLLSGAKLRRELARVSTTTVSSPGSGASVTVDVAVFDEEAEADTEEEPELNPWQMQVRELFVVGEEKTEGSWQGLPYTTPVHDATPQLRWRFVDVDGTSQALDRYQLKIQAFDDSGLLENVWDSGEIEVPDSSIFPGNWIYTDANANDGASVYNSDSADSDDCPDLSQGAISDTNIGDRTYYLHITVWNENDASDSYPRFGENFDDTDLVRFILDKTPPGASMVCGTQRHVPSTRAWNIKENLGDPIELYLQDSNIFWNVVEVKSDTYPQEWREITRNDSTYLSDMTPSVRVKVKDKNNENDEYYGHDSSSEDEQDSTVCSGISATRGNYQYRYQSAIMNDWSDWINCDNIQIVSTGEEASGGEKNVFVWLYANNVPLANGDTNLIQFRASDVAEWTVTKTVGDHVSYISPNMGYSHADTCIEDGVEYSIESDTYGYPIRIDTDRPTVVLLSYPPNPYPHRAASFKWVGIDSNRVEEFKWKLEQGKWVNQTWQVESLEADVDWTNIGSNYGQTSFGSAQLQEGKTYRFYVWARDVSGKESESPATWSWEVSREVPNTIITSGPSGEVHSTSATFSFRGKGGKSPYDFQYQIDGTGWQNEDVDKISHSVDLGTLNEGQHVFEVRAIDDSGSGSTDSSPARQIFVVVTSPPYAPLRPAKLYKYYREVTE